jgi:2',3'-cyclic-nucleotide 2'-phosphodiesterase/3'-nucleotidase
MNRSRMIRRLSLILLLSCLAAGAREVTVRVLATTDLHGNIYPYDYYAAKEAPRGLAKIATLIAAERSANSNTLLIDCGDTIQGTPLEGVYQSFVLHGHLPMNLTPTQPASAPDPMMLAMNALGYDMMTVGNHEWNFSLKNLSAARDAAKFPWISANIAVEPNSKVKPFAPWFVKTVAGVKVAIIGITTPSEPAWEKPGNYAGYRFIEGKEAAAKAVADVQQTEHPDVILIAAHAGLEKEVRKGVILSTPNPIEDLPGENMVYQLATEVPGIDAIIFGHTHSELAGARVGDVLLMQPRNWGMSLGELDIRLDDSADGHWHVASKDSRVIPVTAATPADDAILRIGKPYHETAERFLNSPVAESPVAMTGATARVQDSPLAAMIHEAQLFYAKADVSFASIFNAGLRIVKGPATVRQIAGLYLYDNTLYAVEGNGKMVRDALENSARFFLGCTGECNSRPLINSSVLGYNYDMAASPDNALTYEIDLRLPVGQRIRNLRYRGQPLADDQKLRIAVNNYRYGGGAGYTMFKASPVAWRSTEEIRDLIIDYYTEHKTLPAKPFGSWKVVPESAARELLRDTSRQSAPVLK